MPSITQEAKNALLASIEERILKLEKERTPNYGSVCVGITECVEAIESFPTHDGFIPVKEKLPKDGQTVLAKWSDGRYEVVTKETTDDGFYVFRSAYGYRDTYGIHNFISWQPLPNPPVTQ